MSLRDQLNERKWRTGDLDEVELVVVHRGAPGDQRVVYGSDIVAIRANGLLLDTPADPEEPTYLPYHRILEVRMPEEGEP